MTCPSDLSFVLLEIIKAGVLRSRASGWAGDARRSAIEMDHIHNLPDLLIDFTEPKLKYYWEVERPAFVEQLVPKDLGMFKSLWERLAAHDLIASFEAVLNWTPDACISGIDVRSANKC